MLGCFPRMDSTPGPLVLCHRLGAAQIVLGHKRFLVLGQTLSDQSESLPEVVGSLLKSWGDCVDLGGSGAGSAIFALDACLNRPSGCHAAYVAYAHCLVVLGFSGRGSGMWLKGPGTSWGCEGLGCAGTGGGRIKTSSDIE